MKQNDFTSGEEMTYTYDSLNRLIGAVTTDPSWGQAFTYDGFGNRTSATVTKGSAPYGNWFYDPATNRMGGYSYDANGNMLTVPGVSYGQVSYDVENRLVSVPTGAFPEQYAYTPDNKRIWRRKPDGTEELYFYGISGQKLGTYTPFIYNNGSFVINTLDTNLYFGSRTIVSRGVTVQPDRLGSNRAGGSRYFPYGEEEQVTAQDRDKFATYYRDGTTGLDYAQNRYYASTLARFLTPDPYMSGTGSGTPDSPQSWNRYTYVLGDPINYVDRKGLFAQDPQDPERTQACDPDPTSGSPDSCYPHPIPVPTPTHRPICSEVISVPTDQGEIAAVQRVLNENGYSWIGKQTYLPSDTYGKPTGPVYTRSMVAETDDFVVSVLVNRARLGPPAFPGITNLYQAATIEPNPQGIGIYQRAVSSDYASSDCDNLMLAIQAVEDVVKYGPVRSDIFFWKAVIQPNNPPPGNHLRPFNPNKDIRIGFTDFRIWP